MKKITYLILFIFLLGLQVKAQFIKDLKTTKIEIGTEEMQREDGTRNVSTIEIAISKAESKQPKEKK